MYLIDNHIRRRRQWRTLILFPAFRIGFTHIDNGGTLSVHTYCMRIDARCITQPLTVDFHIESIELAFQVLLYLSRPRTVFSRRHDHCFISMPAVSRIVQHQAHFVRRRRPKRKLRGVRTIFHFRQAARTDRIKLIRGVFFLRGGATDNCCRSYSDNDKIV